jgi:hypothetical protein
LATTSAATGDRLTRCAFRFRERMVFRIGAQIVVSGAAAPSRLEMRLDPLRVSPAP